MSEIERTIAHRYQVALFCVFDRKFQENMYLKNKKIDD
jgi:hypothetical protein